MLKPFIYIKKLFNTLFEILIINYKLIILLLILFILIVLFFKSKSIIISKIKRLANIIISKIKQISNNIYKIKFRNLMYISISTILFFIIFEFIRYLIPNKFYIHLGLDLDIDFLTSYSCVLGLILPLAILLIEKMHDKHDYILIETYLKDTMIFPFIIYFCINLVIITFISEQYYFIITSIISVILIIYMYYKSFKLLSDLRYEQEKISEVRYEIINNDLNSQIQHFDDKNKIRDYLKYGIKVNNYDYINTIGYKKIILCPSHDLRIIESYNMRLINKITKELKILNKEYIENNSIKEDKIEQNKLIEPNIIIGIQNIGSTLMKDNPCIVIYYKEKIYDDAIKIQNMISERIYNFSEYDYHFYVKANYEYLEKECIEAIDIESETLLTNGLNKYYEIYKDYIESIRENIGDYSYENSYNQLHSITRLSAYELLDLIRDDIVKYSNVILKKQNHFLMNALTSFLYKMILYSYKKNELLSIQHLYSLFNYLNNKSLELKTNYSCEKIKLEIFEFMNIITYDITPDSEFQRDVLLICNKNLGNMLFSLSQSENTYFNKYLKKSFDFIKRINTEYKQVKNSDNEKNKMLASIYYTILKNYNCNLFATIAYIVKNKEKNNKEFDEILNYYKNYSVDNLTTILLKCIEIDYHDRTYSWDLYEDRDYDEGAFTVNTNSYLIHLYCLLLNRRNSNNIVIPTSYQLNTYVDVIKAELSALNNEKLIEKFDELIVKINEQKKEYLRSNNILESKVKQFKTNFLENYYKGATLYNLMKNTNNFEIVKKRKKGKHYLGVNNILDKTYFLEKTPFDKVIIWTNFEDNFSNCFIRAEEEKFSNLLEKHSQQISENFIHYLEKLKNKEIENLIIFSDFSSMYNILSFTDIVYTIPEDYKDKVLNSNQYFKYNNYYIPIFIIHNLNEEVLYLYNKNNIGKMQKDENEFQISIDEFSQDNTLLEKVMNEDINGLDLVGVEKKNHLLESVQLEIKEYIYFDENGMNGKKFLRNNDEK